MEFNLKYTFKLSGIHYKDLSPAVAWRKIATLNASMVSDIQAAEKAIDDNINTSYGTVNVLLDIGTSGLFTRLNDSLVDELRAMIALAYKESHKASAEISKRATLNAIIRLQFIDFIVDKVGEKTLNLANAQSQVGHTGVVAFTAVNKISTAIVTTYIQAVNPGPVGAFFASAYSTANDAIIEVGMVARNLKEEVDWKSLGINMVIGTVVNFAGGKLGEKLKLSLLGSAFGRKAAQTYGTAAVEQAIDLTLTKIAVAGPMEVAKKQTEKIIQQKGTITWEESIDAFTDQFSKQGTFAETFTAIVSKK